MHPQDTSVDEAEIRAKYDNDTMCKVGSLLASHLTRAKLNTHPSQLRVDQLKEFLKSKSLPVSGKKADLIDRVAEYFDRKG